MKKRNKWNYLGLIGIGAVLAFGITPRSTTLSFVQGTRSITGKSDLGDQEEQILSVTGVFNGQTVEGLDHIEIPRTIQEGDQVILRSTTDSYTAYFDFGGENAGGMSTNAQDSEYLSRTTLSAFQESQTLEHPQDHFEDLPFADYLKQAADRGYAILFAVKGDTTAGWDCDMDQALQQLGISITPSQLAENDSYVGYYFQNESWSTSSTHSSAVYKSIGGMKFYLSSGGVYSGNKAMIKKGEQDFSANQNGFNIVVYDIVNDQLIDSVAYHTNVNPVTMDRADDRFYTEYVTVYQSALLEQALAYTQVFYVVQCIVSVAFALLLLGLFLDLKYCFHHELSRGFQIRRQILLSLCFMLYASAIAGLNYMLTQFKGITVDQLMFHMSTNLDGTNWSTFLDLILTFLLYNAIALALSLLWTFGMKRVFLKMKDHAKGKIIGVSVHWSAVFCAMLCLFLTLKGFWESYHVGDYLAARSFETTLYTDYYVDPTTVNLTFPNEKKNLIYIFLESMEISAADEANGGGKAFNAIEELTDLAYAQDNFAGDTGVLNGAIPLYNSTWTIAGMVAQSSGLPLGINHNQTNYTSVNQFMPGATTLGDLLETQGYNNVFLLGSKAQFGNRDSYYTEHGDYEIDDYTWAKENGKLPSKDYYVWWGYEDQKLYTYAEEKLNQLASEEEPFALTMLTVDTHFTGGYKCEECPTTFTDRYSNVLACASKQVTDFISWVQTQSWGKDTVIVVSGDHLCMDSVYYGDMPTDYERKTYFTVVNSQQEEPDTYRTFSTMDLFPTTLSALGVKIPGNRLGLGTDLYSSTPTLLEELGESKLNYELSLNSAFYNEQILGY